MWKKLERREDFFLPKEQEDEARKIERLQAEIERKERTRVVGPLISVLAAFLLIGWPGALPLLLIQGRSSAILFSLAMGLLYLLLNGAILRRNRECLALLSAGKKLSEAQSRRQRFFNSQAPAIFLVAAMFLGVVSFLGRSGGGNFDAARNSRYPMLRLEALESEKSLGRFVSYWDPLCPEQYDLTEGLLPLQIAEERMEIPLWPRLSSQYYKLRGEGMARSVTEALRKQWASGAETWQNGAIEKELHLVKSGHDCDELWLETRQTDTEGVRLISLLARHKTEIVSLHYLGKKSPEKIMTALAAILGK